MDLGSSYSCHTTLMVFIGNVFNAWTIYEAPSTGMTIFIWLLCGVFLPFLLLETRLISKVRDDYLYIAYFPLERKKFFKKASPKSVQKNIIRYGIWWLRTQ